MTGSMERLEWLVKTLGLHQPTEEQATVITHPLTVSVGDEEVAAPLLVVAGAGSGKTETMSLRAVYLADTAGIPDEAILGLTFTRKAAAELESRLTERLAQLSAAKGNEKNRGLLEFESSPTATTYNAFALDVVREFGPMIGLPGDLGHLGEAASWQLMLDVVESWRKPLRGDFVLSTVADRAMKLREAIANQGFTVEQARLRLERFSERFTDYRADRGGSMFANMERGLEANLRRLELLEVVAEFEKRKKELARVDFADQVILANRIVQEAPAARDELRRRHRVVFLDEFQDTSVAQLRFLSTLFSDHPVTAVGDPNQAIYGWRGASAASLEDFHRMFGRRAGTPKTTATLSTAWRNSRAILEVANHVAEPLRKRPSWDDSGTADESSASGPELRARDGAPQGTVSIRYRKTLEEQIAEITGFVEKTYRQAAVEGAPTPTIAVLCRTRRLISPVLEALLSVGFAAETGGSDGLLLHPTILDLRAALEIANDIGRSSQLLRLLANLDLGSRDLWLLKRWAEKLSRAGAGKSPERPPVLLLEAVDRILDLTEQEAQDESEISATGIHRLHGLAENLRAIRRTTDRTILEQVEHARRVMGLDQQALAIGRALDVTEVLDSFTQTAVDYQETTLAPTLRGFLGWLDAAENRERGLSLPAVAPNPEAAQVMTIHGAKGLEWDAVAVIDMEAATFPSFPASGRMREPRTSPVPQWGWWGADGELPYPVRDDRRHLPDPPVWDATLKSSEIEVLFKEDIGAYLEAEERRLAYVAMTRPRHSLLLLGSWMVTGVSPRCPSAFLYEAVDAAPSDVVIDECPTDEEIAQLQTHETSEVFPREPGERRKQIAISARMVEQEIDSLEPTGDWSIDLHRVLASIDDPELVRRAEFLTAEYFEQKQRRLTDPKVRAERDVRSAAGSETWEFAATQLFDLAASDEIWLDLRRPLPREVKRSSGVGTAFHEWVETELRRVPAAGIEMSVGTLPTGGTEEAVAEGLPSPHAGDDEGQAAAVLTLAEQSHIKKLQQSFREIPWLQRLQVVGIEIPFAFEASGILLRGRIDAVFKDPESNEYWLIDWKTGRPPEYGVDDEHIGKYASQLAIYKEAWRRRIGDQDAKLVAKLVFVSENGVREVGHEELQAHYLDATGTEWRLDDVVGELGQRLTADN